MEELIEIDSGLDVQVNGEIEMEIMLQSLHNIGEIIFFRSVVTNHQHLGEGQIVKTTNIMRRGKMYQTTNIMRRGKL